MNMNSDRATMHFLLIMNIKIFLPKFTPNIDMSQYWHTLFHVMGDNFTDTHKPFSPSSNFAAWTITEWNSEFNGCKYSESDIQCLT